MAKKVHSYTLKGNYDHKTMVIAEYDKKTEETSYYSLNDILSEFDNKELSITVEEEDTVQPIEQSFDDDDEE